MDLAGLSLELRTHALGLRDRTSNMARNKRATESIARNQAIAIHIRDAADVIRVCADHPEWHAAILAGVMDIQHGRDA